MKFTLEINPYSKLSIVRMSVIPEYSKSYIAHDIAQNYVFIFETYFNPNSELNGSTDIYLAPVSKLELFHPSVKESKQYDYNGKTLIINEFVEITMELTEHERKYIAILKQQPHKNRDGKINGTTDMRILLLTDNGYLKKRCDNIPVIQLGPEFEIYLEYYRANKMLKYTENSQTYLWGLHHRTRNADDKAAIKRTLELVKKEIANQRLKTDIFFNAYLDKKDLYK